MACSNHNGFRVKKTKQRENKQTTRRIIKEEMQWPRRPDVLPASLYDNSKGSETALQQRRTYSSTLGTTFSDTKLESIPNVVILDDSDDDKYVTGALHTKRVSVPSVVHVDDPDDRELSDSSASNRSKAIIDRRRCSVEHKAISTFLIEPVSKEKKSSQAPLSTHNYETTMVNELGNDGSGLPHSKVCSVELRNVESRVLTINTKNDDIGPAMDRCRRMIKYSVRDFVREAGMFKQCYEFLIENASHKLQLLYRIALGPDPKTWITSMKHTEHADFTTALQCLCAASLVAFVFNRPSPLPTSNQILENLGEDKKYVQKILDKYFDPEAMNKELCYIRAKDSQFRMRARKYAEALADEFIEIIKPETLEMISLKFYKEVEARFRLWRADMAEVYTDALYVKEICHASYTEIDITFPLPGDKWDSTYMQTNTHDLVDIRSKVIMTNCPGIVFKKPNHKEGDVVCSRATVETYLDRNDL